MDDRTIARWRVHALRLAGPRFATADEVVGGLLAVQAENHAQASWAVATRTTDTTGDAFANRYDAGAILRTHVLRPTWHYVLPDDIRWLLELTAPRVRPAFTQLQKQLDVDDAMLARSREVIAGALEGGNHRTRAELAARLEAAGLPTKGLALVLLINDAELVGLICSGPIAGTDHTYALLAERVPPTRPRERDEALAELVLRYFTGHGPATERDLAYWATMTLTDVRAGLAAVGDRLEAFEHDGRTYWYGQDPPAAGTAFEPRAHLLQTLDEYHNGYQDSRYVLDVAGLVPRRRQATVGMALIDTQMVGGMRRTVTGRAVRFAVDVRRDLDDDEVAALQGAAARYGAFLDRTPDLRLSVVA